MTDREKLIELIKVFDEAPEKTCPYPEGEPDCENCEYNINKFLCDVQARKADYLIKNRVYVAPCDVGDTVYWLDLRHRVIHKRKVAEILISISRAMLITLSDGNLHGASNYGITLFPTREEAEKALKERDKND